MSIIGMKVHSWTVKEKHHNPNKKYNYDYVCECECGNTKVFTKGNIERSNISKCNLCEKEEILNKNFEEFNKFYINANGAGLDIKTVDIDKKHQLQCDKKHKFTTSIRKYEGCSKCNTLEKLSNRKKKESLKNALAGNNFKNAYPYQSKFWDYETNELGPEEVMPVSKIKYNFICENGHRFSKSPAQIKLGSWCPVCNENASESRLASIVKGMCKTMFDEVKFENEFPIKVIIDNEETTLYPDIIIEDIKLNIEIHGSQHFKFTPQWHDTRSEFLKCKERDKLKKEKLESMGYLQLVIPTSNNLDRDIERVEDTFRRILNISF